MTNYKKLTFESDEQENEFFSEIYNLSNSYISKRYQQSPFEVKRIEFNCVKFINKQFKLEEIIAEEIKEVQSEIGSVYRDSIEYMIFDDKIHLIFSVEIDLIDQRIYGDAVTSELWKEIEKFRDALSLEK